MTHQDPSEIPAPTAAPPTTARRLDMTGSALGFVGLAFAAAWVFWPGYLSRLGQSDVYTHAHATTAAVWLLLLIVQPVLIRRGQRSLHRVLGRASFALVPLVLVSMVLLAHSRIAGATEATFGLQSYLLYLQLSLALLFASSYGLALWTRRVPARHARFMVLTGFTLIDPVLHRLLTGIASAPGFNMHWLSFGLIDAGILALAWLDRGRRRGGRVFAAMLPVFVLAQLPLLLQWTETERWQAFAHWFAALSLT